MICILRHLSEMALIFMIMKLSKFLQQCPGNLEFDVWIICSGPRSMSWILDKVAYISNESIALNMAIDFQQQIPGKYKTENIINMAQKSNRAIIVLGPETSEKELLEYQIKIALLKDPDKILVVYLGLTTINITLPEIIETERIQNYPEQNPNTNPKPTLKIPQTFKYNVWIIYSGHESANRFLTNLMLHHKAPLNPKVAIDFKCETPGVSKVRCIEEMAVNSNKAVVVVDSKPGSRWFRYQVEVAILTRHPDDIIIVHCSPKSTVPECLEPFQRIHFEDAVKHNDLGALVDLNET